MAGAGGVGGSRPRLVSAPRASVCLPLKERELKQKDQQWPAL